MTVYVALLRGINVGGRSMLPMAQLRALAEECGFEAVRSYIQSGNLVFTSPDPAADVAARLEAAIAAAGGPAPRAAVRSRDELAAVVAGNPYLERSPTPSSCTSHSWSRAPSRSRPTGSTWPRFAPEELTVAAARPTCSCRTGSAAASWPRPCPGRSRRTPPCGTGAP